MNKWLKKYGWIILAAIFALIIVPGLVQLLMTKVFTTTNGGSNDGWLGFWGGYLGSIIAIVGVYWSVKEQHRDLIESEKRESRPRLRSMTKDKLNAGDSVYHSTNFVPDKEIQKSHFRLENIASGPAIDILFAVYNMKGHIVDIISIPSLKEKAIIIYCREQVCNVSKIEVVFTTLRDEYGEYVETFNEDGKYLPPKISWGIEAKRMYNFVKEKFDKKNQNFKYYEPEFFSQNISIFSEDDIASFLKR